MLKYKKNKKKQKTSTFCLENAQKAKIDMLTCSFEKQVKEVTDQEQRTKSRNYCLPNVFI